MKTKVCCEQTRNLGLLILRLSIASIFIIAGWMKLGNMEMVTGMFGEMGYPVPAFFAYLVALVELVGGVAVALGIYTALFSYLLAFIMLVAFFTVHMVNGFMDPGTQLVVTLFGSTMGLASAGPGKWSVMRDCCGSCSKE